MIRCAWTQIIFWSFTLLILSTACGTEQEPSTEVASENDSDQIVITKEQWEQGGFETVRISKLDFYRKVTLTGKMVSHPAQQYQISSFFGGTVSGLKIKNGDLVSKGQTLFYLEGPRLIDLQRNYWEAKADYIFSAKNYNRQLDLRSDSIVSEKVFQEAEAEQIKAKANYESLKAKLHLLGLDLDKLEAGSLITRIPVKAPKSGFISYLKINSGYFLQPNEAALQIHNHQAPLLELQVFEKDFGNIQVNQNLQFFLQSAPGLIYQAKISSISPDFNQDGSAIVYATISQDLPHATFAHGMYVEAEVETNAEQKHALPTTAISKKGERYVALRMIEGQGERIFQEVEVEVGLSQGGAYELKNLDSDYLEYVFLKKGVFQLIED